MNSRGIPSSPQARTDEYGFQTVKPPRPVVKTGAGLLIVGGAAHIVGVFLPWYQGPGEDLHGLDTFVTPDGAPFHAPGTVWLVVGLLLFGCGLAMYVANRVYPIAIIATILAVVGVFTSLLGVGAANNMKKFNGAGAPAIGCWIGIMSILLALAGAIQCLAHRRR